MSTVANHKATETELCDHITNLTSQTDAFVKQEVKRVLQFGTANGFIVKHNEYYSLPSRNDVCSENADDRGIEVDNNLYETDNPRTTDKEKIDVECIRILHNDFNGAEDYQIFTYLNKIQELCKSLPARRFSYESTEYELLVLSFKDFQNAVNEHLETILTRVRNDLEYFQNKLPSVQNNDYAEFAVSLTKLLQQQQFFDAATTQTTSPLRDDEINVWNGMSVAVNNYINQHHPTEYLAWNQFRENENGMVNVFQSISRECKERLRQFVLNDDKDTVTNLYEAFKILHNDGILELTDIDLYEDIIEPLALEIQTYAETYMELVRIEKELLLHDREIQYDIQHGHATLLIKTLEEIQQKFIVECPSACIWDSIRLEFIMRKSIQIGDDFQPICLRITNILTKIINDCKLSFAEVE